MDNIAIQLILKMNVHATYYNGGYGGSNIARFEHRIAPNNDCND